MLDASVEGGVEDTMHFLLNVSALFNIWVSSFVNDCIGDAWAPTRTRRPRYGPFPLM
jgi:hypothetical protein